MRTSWVPAIALVVALSAIGCSHDVAYPIRTPVPIAPLGALVEAGRVEMRGSGFAVTIPADWTTEAASPDPDITQAQPGDAWEALRAYDPERRQTCSVYVAVAPAAGLATMAFSMTPGLTGPRWTGSAPDLTLELPEPQDRIGDRTGESHEHTASLDRSAEAPVLDHDVVYLTVCAADGPPSFATVIDTLETLPLG